MIKLVAVAGPTMAGKTALGLRLAKDFNGAVISADSRSIYKSLNIGTNKPILDYHSIQKTDCYEIDGVDHYGFDLVEIGEKFTVKDFQNYAVGAISKIDNSRQVPFLVGGTGLYIESIIDQFHFPEQVVVDEVTQAMSLKEIINEIYQSRPELLNGIDLNNRRRLEPILMRIKQGKESEPRRLRRPGTLLLVVNQDRQELYKRSDRQVDLWLKRGLIDEVAKLNHLEEARIKQLGLVYYLTWQYLQGGLSESEFNKKLKFGLHALIRRQLTWWRRRPDANWVSSYTESKDLIAKFLGE